MPSVATPRITIQPLSNSISFHPETYNGLQVLGQCSYDESIQDWQDASFKGKYTQKATFDDPIVVMFHIQFNPDSLAALYLCDQYKNEIVAIDLNSSPYFKGYVFVPGNNDTDPNTGLVTALVSVCYAFKFSDFPSDIPDGGFYYLRFDNIITSDTIPDISYFSEPILLADNHADTQLYQYAYNSNIARKNIIAGGWFNDWPFESVPYSLVFSIRCESYKNLFVPKVINIGYNQQSYRQLQIKTDQVTTYTLKIGEISIGVPYYMLQKVTEALLADKLTIDNFLYIVDNPQSQSTLAELWKIQDSDVSPLIYASCNIRIVSESQNAMRTPTTDAFGRIFSEEFDPTFD